jgi:hypothetical protein
MNTYLKSLAHEYLETIRMISSGMYSIDEIRDLESQRGLLHDQIIEVLGVSVRRSEMPNYLRNNVI